MDEAENTRQALYERFLESLRRPVAERFFDEDELVEIFDYSGDLNDDYVRLEVLMCGFRLYPESDALAARRAVFYKDFDGDGSESCLGRYLSDNSGAASTLWSLGRMSAFSPATPEEAHAALDYLLAQTEVFADEEAIQLVKLADELECYDWLFRNLDLLRTKVSYPPALLYEIVRVADKNGDHETAISILEGLIEKEPFSGIYWALMFRAQARRENEKEARSAFEYAKALAEADEPALLFLVEVIYEYAPYLHEEAIAIIDGLIDANPDKFDYVDCKAAQLMRRGERHQAIACLLEYFTSHPDCGSAVKQLLACGAPMAADCLRVFYAATDGRGFDLDTFNEIASSLHSIPLMSSLEALLGVALEYGSIDISMTAAYLEALYSLGKYEACYELFKDIDLSDNSSPHRTITLYAVGLLSALRTAHYEKARELARDILRISADFMGVTQISNRAMLLGISTIARRVLAITDSELAGFFKDYYDPLRYGKFS